MTRELDEDQTELLANLSCRLWTDFMMDVVIPAAKKHNLPVSRLLECMGDMFEYEAESYASDGE